MAYSVEKRAASMIKKLQKKLSKSRNTHEKARLKTQISNLRAESQKAQAKRAHAKPAKKAAPKTRARDRVTTNAPQGTPGSKPTNQMSRKGVGVRKLTQAEGRAALNKNTKKPTPARKTITRMSSPRGGTVPMKGIRTRRPRPSSFDRGRSSSPVFNINK